MISHSPLRLLFTRIGSPHDSSFTRDVSIGHFFSGLFPQKVSLGPSLHDCTLLSCLDHGRTHEIDACRHGYEGGHGVYFLCITFHRNTAWACSTVSFRLFLLLRLARCTMNEFHLFRPAERASTFTLGVQCNKTGCLGLRVAPHPRTRREGVTDNMCWDWLGWFGLEKNNNMDTRPLFEAHPV